MVLSFDRWIGKVAVVTGASAGIGANIAEHLVKKGAKVAALARREDRLAELAKKLDGEKGKLYPIKTDISKEEDILNTFKWIKENLGPVHILINNAGILDFKKGLTDGDTETWQNIFQVNVIGLCTATREAIKDMKANNVDGHIIHINSLTGHKVFSPNGMSLNVYPASKHAVTALTETLRLELVNQKSKIKITSISPGGVLTDILDNSFPKEQLEYIKELMRKNELLQPVDITDAVLYVLSTPPHVQVHEIMIRSVGEKD